MILKRKSKRELPTIRRLPLCEACVCFTGAGRIHGEAAIFGNSARDFVFSYRERILIHFRYAPFRPVYSGSD